MPNGPKCYLVLDTWNHYSPSMTLRFIKTSPFKYLKSMLFGPALVLLQLHILLLFKDWSTYLQGVEISSKLGCDLKRGPIQE